MKKTVLLICTLFLGFHFMSQQLPVLNAKIIAFVDKNIGKKVGRGECWDLAQIPLDEYHADWDGQYNYGKKIDYKKDKILPGDIIQFEKVVIKQQEGNKFIITNLPHHTAIVYEVLGDGIFKIANQNTNTHGKKVSIDELNTNYLTKGKIQFYRPEEK